MTLGWAKLPVDATPLDVIIAIREIRERGPHLDITLTPAEADAVLLYIEQLANAARTIRYRSDEEQ